MKRKRLKKWKASWSFPPVATIDEIGHSMKRLNRKKRKK